MSKKYGLFNSALGYASPITGLMGLDPIAPDYLGMAQQSEARRRTLINSGLSQINAIYGGGTVQSYNQATQYDPNASYYRNAGTKGFKPYLPNQTAPSDNGLGGPGARNVAIDVATGMPHLGSILRGLGAFDLFGFDKNSETPEQFRTRHLKEAIQRGQLYTQDTNTYQGFTPDFYNKRAQSYIDYAMPQLSEQANQTRSDLTYNLANRGVYNSSIARRQASGFNRNLATQEQGVYDSARGQAMDLQKQVESSRQAAIQQLYTTQNPNQAASSALNSYFNLSQPSIFQPIGNAFSNILNQYYASNIIDPYRSPSYSTINPYATTSPSAGALPSPTYGSSTGGY